jgi:glucokinase
LQSAVAGLTIPSPRGIVIGIYAWPKLNDRIDMMQQVIGLDIGGTKCAVCRGTADGQIDSEERLATGAWQPTLETCFEHIARLEPGSAPLIGVSCGDPQDAKRGLILEPPNLPGWREVPVCQMLRDRFGGEAYLMNDANAGALAEWRWGAGQGCHNVIFITAGTGFGAGVILDDRLYEGTCGAAGEIGHVRLASEGPVGYGKAGSAEGFCSGGGIARMAVRIAQQAGWELPLFGVASWDELTTRHIAEAAAQGDPRALQVFAATGERYGEVLALLVDLFNPERIMLGSVYARCRQWLDPTLHARMRAEALPRALACCEIVPAALGEQIGNLATLAVGLYRSGQFASN